MVNKYFECLAVDGNYSKTRIALMLMGIFVLAIFIWLIVLTVQVNNIENPTNGTSTTGTSTTGTPGTGAPGTGTPTTITTTTKTPEDEDWTVFHETQLICDPRNGNHIEEWDNISRQQCKKKASKNKDAKYFGYRMSPYGNSRCMLFKTCDEEKRVMPTAPCDIYQKIEEGGKWSLYLSSQSTCGSDRVKDKSRVDVTIEECKEEGSKINDQIFMWYGEAYESMEGEKQKRRCSFFNSCDLTKGIMPNGPGATYLLKKSDVI